MRSALGKTCMAVIFACLFISAAITVRAEVVADGEKSQRSALKFGDAAGSEFSFGDGMDWDVPAGDATDGFALFGQADLRPYKGKDTTNPLPADCVVQEEVQNE
ncbi:MAG: hypothetical protein PHH49_03505 [Candidatus Omnitrophica bacterium]|nr:hypothetical protein [Candidatus Omnitrophota bacterium]